MLKPLVAEVGDTEKERVEASLHHYSSAHYELLKGSRLVDSDDDPAMRPISPHMSMHYRSKGRRRAAFV